MSQTFGVSHLRLQAQRPPHAFALCEALSATHEDTGLCTLCEALSPSHEDSGPCTLCEALSATHEDSGPCTLCEALSASHEDTGLCKINLVCWKIWSKNGCFLAWILTLTAPERASDTFEFWRRGGRTLRSHTHAVLVAYSKPCKLWGLRFFSADRVRTGWTTNLTFTQPVFSLNFSAIQHRPMLLLFWVGVFGFIHWMSRNPPAVPGQIRTNCCSFLSCYVPFVLLIAILVLLNTGRGGLCIGAEFWIQALLRPARVCRIYWPRYRLWARCTRPLRLEQCQWRARIPRYRPPWQKQFVKEWNFSLRRIGWGYDSNYRKNIESFIKIGKKTFLQLRVMVQLWLTLFPPLLWLIGIHMQVSWGAVKLLQWLVVVFGDAVHGFSSEVLRVFDLKNYFFSSISTFSPKTKSGKAKTE